MFSPSQIFWLLKVKVLGILPEGRCWAGRRHILSVMGVLSFTSAKKIFWIAVPQTLPFSGSFGMYFPPQLGCSWSYNYHLLRLCFFCMRNSNDCAIFFSSFFQQSKAFSHLIYHTNSLPVSLPPTPHSWSMYPTSNPSRRQKMSSLSETGLSAELWVQFTRRGCLTAFVSFFVLIHFVIVGLGNK